MPFDTDAALVAYRLCRAGEDLELLTAACEIVRGHQDYKTVDE